jgi:hypothetical protein
MRNFIISSLPLIGPAAGLTKARRTRNLRHVRDCAINILIAKTEKTASTGNMKCS